MSNATIAAIVTAPGVAGVAIVRISGAAALAIGEKICRKKLIARQIVVSNFYNSQETAIDQGIALYFRAPNSFTGEDVVELQGHGGVAVSNLLLQTCLQAGARLATGGEFSLRAFLNGKIDLTQAEAIADLINAQSQQAIAAANRSLSGDFSQQVNALGAQILAMRTTVEAMIDFSEYEIDELSARQIATQLQNCGQKLTQLITASNCGKVLNEGANVLLLGAPNAGKSSLLNALIAKQRAIVSDIAGTTRDVIEAQTIIDGIAITLFDCAGLHDSCDALELEGMRRTHQALADADIVLALLDVGDATVSEEQQRQQITQLLDDKKRVIWIYSKADKANGDVYNNHRNGLWVSATTRVGIDDLKEKIGDLCGQREQICSTFIARERHLKALQLAARHQLRAQRQLEMQCFDLLAEELHAIHDCLGEIVGKVSSDELLGEIFATFCVGK